MNMLGYTIPLTTCWKMMGQNALTGFGFHLWGQHDIFSFAGIYYFMVDT
jgi:hypothetical protein